jgi:hypothetical protein
MYELFWLVLKGSESIARLLDPRVDEYGLSCESG